jgi:sugar phosphate isomerase/epimerase
MGPGADLDHVLARMSMILDTCAGLAAPLLCVDVGELPEPPRVAPPVPTKSITAQMAGLILIPEMSAPAPVQPTPAESPAAAAHRSQIVSGLIELGRLADRFGVTVAMRTELASYAALESVLREAACPWFGIDLDPPAILQDRWPWDEIASRLGPMIRHLRGRDAVKGSDHRTRSTRLGKGDVDWPRILGDLESGGYSGWITIDPLDLADRKAGASEAVEFLRSTTFK